ncbi:MAG: aminoacetone oxidase family FAD-binding enzyme [Clostridia bacterium]|nr:aminoacetone oxidase family FAD-binding enzyme [Clostridia bacterium]
MNRTYDVCIIGGGASGLAAAVYIKQKNNGISVAILERLNRVGKKLITTGNGRCNITNTDEAISHYHGEDPAFALYALKKYGNGAIKDFFFSLGVPLFADDTGRMYPLSLQASSVVDALRFSASALGVDIFTECEVTDVRFGEKGNVLKTTAGDFTALNVIFAAGLYSGGAKLGCDGKALGLLKSKGFKTVKTTPAIVQVKTENAVTRQLKGIKVNAAAALVIDGNEVRSEVGEVLFCDYGLSGPPVLQIAREIERRNGYKLIRLDLMPNKSINEVLNLLFDLKKVLFYRNLDEYLSGLLNKRLGQVIVKAAGMGLSQPVSSLDESGIKRIAGIIKNFEFKAISTAGFDNSQVTAGGLDTSAFDPQTLMSKSFKNVYAIGEILDIDGDCGGYNLHFAFSSAFCAADSIIKGCCYDKA